MSFDPNIPNLTDKILQSQGQIKSNFQAINASFSDNHVGYPQDSEFYGMHNVLRLNDQKMVDPITDSTHIAIYNKLVSSIPALFFRPNNNQTPIQMTYLSLSTGLASTNPDVYLTRQYSFVAGPFIIYGGKVHNPTQGQMITLTPGTTLLFVDTNMANLNITSIVPAVAAPTSVSGTSFNINYAVGPGTNFDVYYFAVGI